MSLLIGNRFIISRDPESLPGGRVPLFLAHGRAFGSGEHETTSSCIEELEQIPVAPDFRVLDLGCGTGILAIAAARLGARNVVALDPSPDAILTASATIRLNRLNDAVFPIQGEIGAVGRMRFDLILAYLYGDLLLDLVHPIVSVLKPGGYLVLSGIQYADAYDLKTRFAGAGCTIVKDRYLEDYCTLVFRRAQA